VIRLLDLADPAEKAKASALRSAGPCATRHTPATWALGQGERYEMERRERRPFDFRTPTGRSWGCATGRAGGTGGHAPCCEVRDGPVVYQPAPGSISMIDALPQRVREFVVANVDSIGLLEVLLALAAEPRTAFTAERVSDQLRTSPMSAHSRLRCLHERGLVEELPDKTFRFASSGELAETVRAVAQAYRDRRVTVMTLIYSRSSQSVRP